MRLRWAPFGRASVPASDAPTASGRFRAPRARNPALRENLLPEAGRWQLAAGSYSCSVIRVDFYVLGAQIAGPNRGLFGAAGAQIHLDVDLCPVQVARGFRRIRVVRLAVLEQD